MAHQNSALSKILSSLDLGSSVAELDTLLETARVETSTFTDLFADRVDLIPGTKGSGKSALFRIFTDFLPENLLRQKRVVVAHGVQAQGDPVFHAFTDQFEGLSESEFVSFWCIYLVSLANEQFLKGQRYKKVLQGSEVEIRAFQSACAAARIPEIEAKKSLRDILEWTLRVLSSWRPKVTFQPPGDVGEFELDLFGNLKNSPSECDMTASDHPIPQYVNEIKQKLESILVKSGLSLWLMVDRLDEIFPRRSRVESKALTGILRATQLFSSEKLRVKVFLRDDMLEQIVRGPEGFTALTHVTARQADTLRWDEDQILAMVTKRFFANEALTGFLQIDLDSLNASASYRKQAFGKIFPEKVFQSDNQSATISWICKRCADGRGVFTPRDVLDLLIRAKQRQEDSYKADPDGSSSNIIGAQAIKYGFKELSKRKKETYLQAEFPHFWKHIEKFHGKKTIYDTTALQALLGKDFKVMKDNLLAIGFLSSGKKAGEDVFSIPFLYRHGMNLTRGKA